MYPLLYTYRYICYSYMYVLLIARTLTSVSRLTCPPLSDRPPHATNASTMSLSSSKFSARCTITTVQSDHQWTHKGAILSLSQSQDGVVWQGWLNETYLLLVLDHLEELGEVDRPTHVLIHLSTRVTDYGAFWSDQMHPNDSLSTRGHCTKDLRRGYCQQSSSSSP